MYVTNVALDEKKNLPVYEEKRPKSLTQLRKEWTIIQDENKAKNEEGNKETNENAK